MITIRLYLHVDDELHTCRVRPFPRKRAPRINRPQLTPNQEWLFKRLMWDPKAGPGPYELEQFKQGVWVTALLPWLEQRLQETASIAKFTITWDGPYSFRVITKQKRPK